MVSITDAIGMAHTLRELRTRSTGAAAESSKVGLLARA
jgi:hypothetical protein